MRNYLSPLLTHTFAALVASLLSIGSLFAQSGNLTVSGKVVDEAGESVAGASLLVKGSTTTTLTDGEGGYTLYGVDSSAVMVVSYKGFETKNVPVGGRTTINITLFSTGYAKANARRIADEAGLPMSGVVVDAATGQAIAGVTVSVEGVDAAVTDEAGRFSLSKAKRGNVAQLKMVGYAYKEVTLRSEMSIGLHDETFGTAYGEVFSPFGRQDWRSVSGASGSMRNSNSYKKAVVSPEYLIQDEALGVNTLIRSGAQGAGGFMYLRGFSSINATNQPLILVDGLPYENTLVTPSLIGGNTTTPLSFIDIRNIENITILKDAASIYGSKGANGAILIETTKAQQQATQIDVHAYGGLNMMPDNLYPMLQSWEYRSYLSEMLMTSGLSVADIQALPYINADKPVQMPWGIEGNKDYYRYRQETDWQKEVFTSSMSQNYFMNIRGGDEIALYTLSVGFLNHGGVVKNTDFSRYSMQFNSQINVVRWLKMNASMSASYNDRNLAIEGLSTAYNPMLVSLAKAPFMAPYLYNEFGLQTPNYEQADLFSMTNPTALVDDNTSLNNKTYRFFGHVNAIADLSHGFTLNATFGVTFDKARERLFLPQNGLYHEALSSIAVTNESKALVSRYLQFYGDAFLQYKQIFDGSHKLAARIGARYQNNQSEGDWIEAYNSSSDDMQSVGNGMIDYAKVAGSLGSWLWLSFYLNGEYSFADRYFLSYNMAMDGSSRFGSQAEGIHVGKNTLGVFPSVSLGWLISSEDFMSGVPLIDLLKLRVGYSVAGNDDIGNYSARTTYASQNLFGYYGLMRSNIANPKLRWETNTKINAGIDVALLNERLVVNFDVYKSTTTDLLQWQQSKGYYGIAQYAVNNGEMQNTGFELGIRGRVVNRAFKWDLGLNISRYANEVTSLLSDNITAIAGGYVQTKAGAPMGQFYGYQTDGVYATTQEATAAGLGIQRGDGTTIPFGAGDMRFVNQNTDNIIDESDMTVIGDPNPDFFGAINSAMSWRKITLSTVLTYSYGNDIYNAVRAQMEGMSGYANQTAAISNRWSTEGHLTDVPKATWGDPMGNARFSDRWIEDGSYIRLKTISLSYDIPIKINYIRGVQVYLTANNLLTLTNYLGYDPEFAAQQNPLYYGVDMGYTPQVRSVLVGVKVGL
jgi:TonB-linked SusC/RagA family outer membrane protein